ncbi:hypothetical protein [Effusibacillus dendaii]|uniref:Uncharacterized protein n=1 Tax=Effusibacillus dendaii TaxID=2743772 RepID=A0A7I8DD09_9BACL|nr:hypothetical protein [Effusibacillus dendaii]BCJ88078.1 hypothetical protein skT53_30630 [Effusibacillus dendaii]
MIFTGGAVLFLVLDATQIYLLAQKLSGNSSELAGIGMQIFSSTLLGTISWMRPVIVAGLLILTLLPRQQSVLIRGANWF